MEPLQLLPVAMNYAWGNIGREALIYHLLPQAQRKEDTPYSELWYCAHPHGPAIVLPSSKSSAGEHTARLDALIAKNATEILGQSTIKRFGAELPYLFKVLSVRSTLSIQAHPDKPLAAQLHQRDPQHYPDSNHKPEVGIALSDFSLLCGFRPAAEIATLLTAVPELAALCGATSTEQFLMAVDHEQSTVPALREIFRQLFTASAEKVRTSCQHLVTRLHARASLSPADQWILKLAPQFPEGDVGLFCFYLLNVVTLAPGEAVFMGAGIPHAYLAGDLIECMATSDNTVRAGLTPKYKDVQTLVAMLTYEQRKVAPLLPTTAASPCPHRYYQTAAAEFEVHVLDNASQEMSVSTNTAPQLFVCLRGNATLEAGSVTAHLSAGSAFIVPASLRRYQLRDIDGEIFWVTVPE